MRRLSTFLLMVPLLAALAVSAVAQSPTTTEELLAGMVTEEVEPGVYRIVNDGVRALSLPPPGWGGSSRMVDVAPDGSVWLSGSRDGQDLLRLGEGPVFEDPKALPPYREVAPDGSLWGLGPDGTVWVRDGDGDTHCPDIEDGDCQGNVLVRLEDDGSLTTIEDWADVYDGDADWRQLAVSPDGDVWLAGPPRGIQRRAELLLRFDGEPPINLYVITPEAVAATE